MQTNHEGDKKHTLTKRMRYILSRKKMPFNLLGYVVCNNKKRIEPAISTNVKNRIIKSNMR